MAGTKTLSGEIVTVTETKGGDPTSRHYFTVSGTAQGIIDHLNENNIPAHKVICCLPSSTTWYVMYHK